MSKILSLLFPVVLLLGLCAHQPLVAQTKVVDYTFGGDTDDFNVGAVETADGGILMGSTTRADVSGDITQPPRGALTLNNFDMWIVKLNAQGNKLWDKRYGGSGNDGLKKILVASDGGFLLCGWTSSEVGFDRIEPLRGETDFWVVKIDAQGNKQWDKRFGSMDVEWFEAAVSSSDGGYLLVGVTGTGPATPEKTAPNGDRTQPILGKSDIWMVKIDAQGNKQWDKRLGGFGGELVYDVVNTPNGDFMLACLLFENDGNPIHGGDVTGSTFSTYDYWIVRIDAQGNKIWDKIYGGTESDIIVSLLATPDGGVLATGNSQSPVSGNKGVYVQGQNTWLLKLDGQGNKQWERLYGSPQVASANILTMINNPRGGYLLGGGISQELPPDDLYDFWLVDIDVDGKVRGEQKFGGDKNEAITNIISTTAGNMWLVGSSDSNISRDKTSNSRGGNDIWVVKLASTVLGNKESATTNASSSLFPNPLTQDVVTIEVKGLRNQSSVKTEILNSLGQRVHLLHIPVMQNNISHEVNLAQLAQGMYIVRLYTSTGIITKQLVKN